MKKILLILNILITMPLNSKFIIMGHRGASAYEPENTLRSFKRAIDMGVDMIELDAYLCKSGEVVVIHDETIDRTTNGHGKVKDIIYDKLKNLDAGKGEHIPLLEEVFDLVNQKIIINIEIKDSDTVKNIAELINKYIKVKHWSTDRFIVSSFNHDDIKKFHEYCPSVKTGALFEKYDKDIAKRTIELAASFLIIDYREISEKLIKDAHEAGLKIFAYTVNNKSEAEKLKFMQLNGIATDYPDILENK